MKTIRYDILQENGPRSVAGEPLTIKNGQGMTFGVHCNVYQPFDSQTRYVVTHIESGFSVGNAAMRMLAIDDARMRVTEADKAGTLALSVDNAMRLRAEALANKRQAG